MSSMKAHFVIENASIPLQFDQAPLQGSTLVISEGRLLAPQNGATTPELPRINSAGLWLLPGLVDLSHHLCAAGHDTSITIASELNAAAQAGFAAVCCPPDLGPVNDNAALTNWILDQAALADSVRCLPIGAMTLGLEGEQLSEMHALQEAGCIGVTNLRRPCRDTLVMKRCLSYAASLGIKVFVTPLDATLAAGGCVHAGALASQLGLPGISSIAETLALSNWLLLARETGATLHVGQLSCAGSVDMVRRAKEEGLEVTADVAITNLLYTDQRIAEFNSAFHLTPPLRSEADRQALLDGVNDGTIDAICSNHQPHESASKLAPFAETAPGIACAEFFWPWLVQLMDAGSLSEQAALKAVTINPARIAGLSEYGLRQGEVANMCLLDRDQNWGISRGVLATLGENLPYGVERLKGKSQLTVSNGRLVYQDQRLSYA